MPNLATLHPQVVHFVVALLLVGVLLRLLSFFGRRVSWANPAAATLLILGTGASVVAVRSGLDAHGPVERIPGARDAVEAHEEAGERVRNIFLAVAALELIGLAIRDANRRRWIYGASALVGIVGSYMLVRAGDLGGDLVYEYAGGVGTRSGKPQDVRNLLTASLYNMSRLERKEGNAQGAAALVQELERRNPGDVSVQMLRVESMLQDQRDPRAALARLDSVERAATASPRLAGQIAFFRADAYVMAGLKDSARTVLTALQQAQPQNTRVKAKLDSLR